MSRKARLGLSGARENPGQVRTGLSRTVLLRLEEDPMSIDEILETLGPRSEGVNHGTIWTTLERALQNGLVHRDRKSNPHLYSLTLGGERRVAWIKNQMKRSAERPRAVANPGKNGEE